MNKTADVVIIGGGINGCAAAYYLAKKGVKDVVVLEATNSIGHRQETEAVYASRDVMLENFHMRCMELKICGLHYRRNLV